MSSARHRAGEEKGKLQVVAPDHVAATGRLLPPPWTIIPRPASAPSHTAPLRDTTTKASKIEAGTDRDAVTGEDPSVSRPDRPPGLWPLCPPCPLGCTRCPPFRRPVTHSPFSPAGSPPAHSSTSMLGRRALRCAALGLQALAPVPSPHSALPLGLRPT